MVFRFLWSSDPYGLPIFMIFRFWLKPVYLRLLPGPFQTYWAHR